MYSIIAQSGNTSSYIMEFQVDKIEDLVSLPKSPTCAAGSYCLCLEDSSVWKLGNDNEWHYLKGENGSGGGSAGGDQIVFSKRANFPTVGDSSKIYIDTEMSKSYIYVNENYSLVGDGFNSTDWESIP